MIIRNVYLEATEQERNTLRIMASGYGINWPLIDEDLSIDGLLGMQQEIPEILKASQGGQEQ